MHVYLLPLNGEKTMRMEDLGMREPDNSLSPPRIDNVKYKCRNCGRQFWSFQFEGRAPRKHSRVWKKQGIVDCGTELAHVIHQE